MSMSVVCGICGQVVYPDALVLADHNFGYTWWGDRGRWTHPDFGVVHLCERADVAAVRKANGHWRAANWPWMRWMWFCDRTRPLARVLQPTSPRYPTRVFVNARRDDS